MGAKVKNIVLPLISIIQGRLDVCSYFSGLWLVGWLVVFGLAPFETVFKSISGRLPERGRKRRERTEESKNVQTTPTRT